MLTDLCGLAAPDDALATAVRAAEKVTRATVREVAAGRADGERAETRHQRAAVEATSSQRIGRSHS